MNEAKFFSRRSFLAHTVGGVVCIGARSRSVAAVVPDPFDTAERSARVAGYSISKVQRWLREKALPLIDGETGLYRADGHWNYRDTAADCYPFLCWAAHLVDPDALYGPVLKVLEAEQRLCNYIDRIPVRYDWERKQKDTEVAYDTWVFGASEYVKDGLIAIVEITGPGPWYDRLLGIEEDLWKHARVQTAHGVIPSTNVEVNGEQIQALVRLFTRSGDERFLRWAQRLADYYTSDADYVPARLRDHGCEIIGGLGLLLGIESEADSAKAEVRLTRLERMFDEILRRGTNPDGIMFNSLGNRNSGLSDGWGYNYVALLCHDWVTGKHDYSDAIRRTLRRLNQPAYHDYPWEGKGSIDGYADSIEGAIYLLNRLPVAEAFDWVDREMARNVTRSDEPIESTALWGTMKLESNGVRTVIMHALMHTQGVIARPWRDDLALGAAPTEYGGLALVMSSNQAWKGRLEFDRPRHQLYMNFTKDWPRMNTLPEWFTVKPDQRYRIQSSDGLDEVRTGRELHSGFSLSLGPSKPLRLRVERA